MEITISKGTNGRYEIRTSLGGLMVATSEAEAVAYATGLSAGYNAAVSKLGASHGFNFAYKG